MSGIIESTRTRRAVTFDSYAIMPQGVARIPITARPDLDYRNATRAEMTAQNIQLEKGERRFFGNPNGFPNGTVPLSPVYDNRVVTLRNSANYFRRGSLVVAANSPRPSAEEIANHAGRKIETVFITGLPQDTRNLFAANFLGAFQAAVDIASADHGQITPLGIIHHTPVTDEVQVSLPGNLQSIQYPRSVSFLHGTVGYISTADILSGYRPTKKVRTERRLLTEDVLADLTDKMTGGLAEQGFDGDLVQVRPRTAPNGVDIHLMGLKTDNLMSREAIVFASSIFNAISLAYEQAYPSVLGHVPPSFKYKNRFFFSSPVPAHRQVFHLHDNHAVYGLLPIPIGTNIGGGEASNYKPERSVAYTYTPAQLTEVDIYSRQVTHRVNEAVTNLQR